MKSLSIKYISILSIILTLANSSFAQVINANPQDKNHTPDDLVIDRPKLEDLNPNFENFDPTNLPDNTDSPKPTLPDSLPEIPQKPEVVINKPTKDQIKDKIKDVVFPKITNIIKNCNDTENSIVEPEDVVCVADDESNVVCQSPDDDTIVAQIKRSVVDFIFVPKTPILVAALQNNSVIVVNTKKRSYKAVVKPGSLDGNILKLAFHKKSLYILTDTAKIYRRTIGSKTTQLVFEGPLDFDPIDFSVLNNELGLPDINILSGDGLIGNIDHQGNYRLDHQVKIPDPKALIVSRKDKIKYFVANANGKELWTLISSDKFSTFPYKEKLVDIVKSRSDAILLALENKTVIEVLLDENDDVQNQPESPREFFFQHLGNIKALAVGKFCPPEDASTPVDLVEETEPTQEETITTGTDNSTLALSAESEDCSQYAYSGYNIQLNEETGSCECIDYEYTVTNENGSITCTNESTTTVAPETSEQFVDESVELSEDVSPGSMNASIAGGSCSLSKGISNSPVSALAWMSLLMVFSPLMIIRRKLARVKSKN